MVQVKEAVQRAQAYLPQVFHSAEGQDLRLEGVELTEDAKFWTVTLSYLNPSGPDGLLDPFRRDYKTVKLSADDGQFYGARTEPKAWSVQ